MTADRRPPSLLRVVVFVGVALAVFAGVLFVRLAINLVFPRPNPSAAWIVGSMILVFFVAAAAHMVRRQRS